MTLTPLEITVGLMGCWFTGYAIGHVILWVRMLKDSV